MATVKVLAIGDAGKNIVAALPPASCPAEIIPVPSLAGAEALPPAGAATPGPASRASVRRTGKNFWVMGISTELKKGIYGERAAEYKRPHPKRFGLEVGGNEALPPSDDPMALNRAFKTKRFKRETQHDAQRRTTTAGAK